MAMVCMGNSTDVVFCLQVVRDVEIETATPPDLMRQVLTTIGTLAENDRAMLHAFVTQLAPDVLADVVLSQLANTDGVNRRTMIDVEAGAGRGVETFVLDAMAAHERGDHGNQAPVTFTEEERVMMGTRGQRRGPDSPGTGRRRRRDGGG